MRVGDENETPYKNVLNLVIGNVTKAVERLSKEAKVIALAPRAEVAVAA